MSITEIRMLTKSSLFLTLSISCAIGFKKRGQMKIKQKIDEAVAGQLRKVISRFDKDTMKPIPDDQKVEVVRMAVRTKEEFDKLKASLEEQGYDLTCEEFYEEDVDDKNFSATILGERRIQLTEKELRPPKDPEKEKKKERMVTIGVKAMWWIIFIGVLWIWFLVINYPLTLAIQEALRFYFPG